MNDTIQRFKHGSFSCQKCRREVGITDDYPKYKKGKELCQSCFMESG